MGFRQSIVIHKLLLVVSIFLIGEQFFVSETQIKRVLSQELTQKKQLVEVGKSRFYDSLTYVDMRSIVNLKDSQYKYTTIVDPYRKYGNEEDIVVNCNQPKEIYLVEARYFRNGILHKTEKIDHKQKEEDPRSSYFVANKLVCDTATKN